MSGKGSERRQQGVALTAFRLSQQGLTHKQIAEKLGIENDKVKGKILLGERISQLEDEGK